MIPSKDLTAEQSVANYQCVRAEILGQNGKQNRPLNQFPVYLDPARRYRLAFVFRPNHVRKPRQAINTQEIHHLTKSRLRCAVTSHMSLHKRIDRCGGRHCLQTVFIVTGIDDSYELDQEWIELELIVSAIRTHQRDRRSGARLNPFRLLLQGTNLL